MAAGRLAATPPDVEVLGVLDGPAFSRAGHLEAVIARGRREHLGVRPVDGVRPDAAHQGG